MNFQNVDLRTVDTGLSDEERRALRYEQQRLQQREALGERWILHPANAPQKGTYNPLTGQRIS